MSDSWYRFLTDPDPWVPPRPLPGPVETERTVVRLYRKGDGPALFEAIDRSRDTLLPEMVWAATDHRRVDDTIHYVEKQVRSNEGSDCRDFAMAIFDRRSGRVIGGTGFHRIQPGRREVEVGYWIRGDREGNGLCTEAIGGLITSALRPAGQGGWGFRRLLVFVRANNEGSRRVCEKLGLRLESRLRRERWFGPPGVEPGYVDMLGFAVLDDEWDGERHRARPGIGWDPV